MITIYTDGAVSGNGTAEAFGGAGFVCVETGEQMAIPVTEFATNQVCELTAVYAACYYAEKLIYAKKALFPPEEVVIRSDSAYIINCYNQKWYLNWQSNGWKNSKKEDVANQDLWELIIPYFENLQFKFEKVKGHSGDTYNEIADKLANKGKRMAKDIIEKTDKILKECYNE